jgi:cyclohexanone monooxygenase
MPGAGAIAAFHPPQGAEEQRCGLPQPFALDPGRTLDAVRCLDRARRERSTRIEIRPEANRRYFESVLARRARTPTATWRSARLDLSDYTFATSAVPLRAAEAPAGASA